MGKMSEVIRSKIMKSVGRKDTGQELYLRHYLHRKGFRFRLYDKKLPGTPDLVFKKFNAVIFVNGCFWHHQGCSKSSIPKKIPSSGLK